jgi:hypothetical protein
MIFGRTQHAGRYALARGWSLEELQDAEPDQDPEHERQRDPEPGGLGYCQARIIRSRGWNILQPFAREQPDIYWYWRLHGDLPSHSVDLI